MGSSKLPYTVETYKEVFATDLDELVYQVYGNKAWSFMVAMESGRSCYYSFDLVKRELDELKIKELHSWLYENDMQPNVYLVLQDLCNKDFIEEGEYLIYID